MSPLRGRVERALALNRWDREFASLTLHVEFMADEFESGEGFSRGSFVFSCLIFHSTAFFNHCYLETLQHLGHIASRVFGCIPEGCVFLLLCVVDVSILKFTELIL